MKKGYTKPKLEILILDIQDIVMASGLDEEITDDPFRPGYDENIGWDDLF